MSCLGTRSSYLRGCHCGECKEADSRYRADLRRRRAAARRLDADGRLKAPVGAELHGELGTYTNRLCRCALCTEAMRSYAAGGRPPQRKSSAPTTGPLSPDELARLRRLVGAS